MFERGRHGYVGVYGLGWKIWARVGTFTIYGRTCGYVRTSCDV